MMVNLGIINNKASASLLFFFFFVEPSIISTFFCRYTPNLLLYLHMFISIEDYSGKYYIECILCHL